MTMTIRRYLQAVSVSLLVVCLVQSSLAWTTTSTSRSSTRTRMATVLRMQPESQLSPPDTTTGISNSNSRRSVLLQSASAAATLLATLGSTPSLASAAATSTTDAAQVTDRIFVEVKGLGGPSAPPQRIIIGLFGKDAPRSTQMLKQLVNTKDGLPAPCKPKAENRVLQKEQLEANKVYSTCIEQEDKGVTYEYSQIWRIIPNQRIDVGAVSGKFIAREYPNWQEDTSNGSPLKHDTVGVVSARKGNDSGFGFTIYSGPGGDAAAQLLDEEHIVVGRVENVEIVSALNDVPVITSSKFGGGPATAQTAPNRSCTYGGGQLYCNEYKPLNKLMTLNSGVL